ncbi:hypothetical protein [Frankia sp. CiP3]|uniref:hypothetical protein n=1 Tax=Frankia sp. CiP3 TaxID=2880971 RepID=UPI001EF709FB|nr:hypothetical protein [Frankia sp. CiP3]
MRGIVAHSARGELATLIAAVLQQRQLHRDRETRYQLAVIGPDEPRARYLLWALTDVLPPSMSWSSFSSFEADFPNVSDPDRTPDLLFMPDYQPPQHGVSAPTAYVFLDRTRRPHDRNILEFGSSQADPGNLVVPAAKVLVLAYLEPDDTLRRITPESVSTTSDVAAWASSVVRNAQRLGIDLNSWQERDRSMAPSALSQPRAAHGLRDTPDQRPASDVEQVEVRSAKPGVPSTDNKPVWPINSQPSARLSPAEAESVLRNWIRAMGRRKIPDDRHTVDALIDALETRSLISQHEADILHPVLVRLLRDLPDTATRPSRHEARHNASSRHSPNRSVPVGKLIAYANGNWKPTRDEIIEALVSSLMPFNPPETGVRLRNALESLVGPDPHRVDPQADDNKTIRIIGDRLARAIETSTRKISDRLESGWTLPAWTLEMLLDAARDGSLLEEHDLAGLRPALFTRLVLTAPHRQHHPAGQLHSRLDPSTVSVVRRQASKILSEFGQATETLRSDAQAQAADMLVNAIEKISREAVGPPGAARCDGPINDLRNVIDALFRPRPPDESPATSARDAVRTRFEELLETAYQRTTRVAHLADVILTLVDIPLASAWIATERGHSLRNLVRQQLVHLGIDNASRQATTYPNEPDGDGWSAQAPADIAPRDLTALQEGIVKRINSATTTLQQTQSGPNAWNIVAVLCNDILWEIVVLVRAETDENDERLMEHVRQLSAAVNAHVRAWDDKRQAAETARFNRLTAELDQTRKAAATARSKGLDPDRAGKILNEKTERLKTLDQKNQINNIESLVDFLVKLNPLREFLPTDDHRLLDFEKTVENINRKVVKNDRKADGTHSTPFRMRTIQNRLDQQAGVFIALILVALILGVASIAS